MYTIVHILWKTCPQSTLTEGEGDEEGGEGQAEREHVGSPDRQPHELVVCFVTYIHEEAAIVRRGQEESMRKRWAS